MSTLAAMGFMLLTIWRVQTLQFSTYGMAARSRSERSARRGHRCDAEDHPRTERDRLLPVPVAFVIGLAPDDVQHASCIVIILDVLGINLYDAFMSATTTIAAMPRLHIGAAARVGFMLRTAVVGTLVAILGFGAFVENFENSILFLAYFRIRWTAISLVDFYVVRRGRYHMASIFDPNCIFDRWNGRALLERVGGPCGDKVYEHELIRCP